MRAIARAEVFPPAGMSAARTSGRFPKAASGNSDIGADLNIGRSGGSEASIWAAASAAPGSSSSRASRWWSDGGMPNHSSSATPSGPATSSASTAEIRLPVARRTTSPTM